MNSSELIFNIIYVKGTVRTLINFFWSLVHFSDCKYRLISNGCTSEEEAFLSNIAANSDGRFEFHSLGSSNIIEHHHVIHKLITLDHSPYLAFIDSDILAKKPFLEEIKKQITHHDAVFSGLPVWHESEDFVMPRSFKIMGGRYVDAHNGILLGTSYCCIFKKESLRMFLENSNIDFRRYFWSDLDSETQNTLKSLDLKKYYYDTGKVLNIIWQNKGARMAYFPVDGLTHLGGISGEAYSNQQSGNAFKYIKRLIPDPIKVFIRLFLTYKNKITFREMMDLRKLVHKRSISRKLLSEMLLNKNLTPKRKSVNNPVNYINQVINAGTEVQEVLKRFGNKTYF